MTYGGLLRCQSTLIQVMACCLFCAMTLDLRTFWNKFQWNYWRKLIWKCFLLNATILSRPQCVNSWAHRWNCQNSDKSAFVHVMAWQQANTWTNDSQVLGCYMTSLDHNEFSLYVCLDKIVTYRTICIGKIFRILFLHKWTPPPCRDQWIISKIQNLYCIENHLAINRNYMSEKY